MLSERQRFDAALLLAGVALWMAARPYAGIYQDANLYLLMALNWLVPDAYARDPWFLFGSQDSYSVFSPIYGMFLSVAGISDGARGLVLLGGALWLAASWLAVRRICADTLPRAVAFLCCAVFSINISPVGSTFVLNENFATARLLAVPLGIGAVAWNPRGMPVLPWVLGGGALVLHPLFGIWALLFLIAFRLPERLLAVAVAFGILLPFVVPADLALPLLTPLAPERWALLRDTAPDLLLSDGAPLRLNPLLFWLGALMVGGQWGREDFRRAYRVIALLAAAGYLLSLVVSNYQPLTLLVQAQPWRAVWLAAYFSVIALVDVAWRLGRGHPLGWYWVALIALALVLCKPVAGYVLLVGWAICRNRGVMDWLARRPPPSPWAARLTVALAAAVGLPGYLADVRLEGEGLTHFGWSAEDTLRGIIGGGGLGLGPLLVTGALFGVRAKPRLLFPVLLLILAWVGYRWDSRDAIGQRWEESFQAGRALPFAGFLRGQTVHWPGQLPAVWFGLGTAAYVGEYHLSGLVFSERRTELVARRWKRVAVSSSLDGPTTGPGAEERALERFRLRHPERNFGRDYAGNYVSKGLTPAGVAYLCDDPQLDWVVADWPEVAGVAGAIIDDAVSGPARQYAYACGSFRGGVGPLVY